MINFVSQSQLARGIGDSRNLNVMLLFGLIKQLITI